MSPHVRSRLTMIFLAALVLVILWVMVFRTWMSEPISGQVRDAADGTPVEGAAVLATWTIYGGLEGSPLGIWVMREAVSNERGDFRIPSWGPRVWLWGGFLRYFTPDGMAECSFTIDGTPLKDRTQACDSRLGQVQVTVE